MANYEIVELIAVAATMQHLIDINNCFLLKVSVQMLFGKQRNYDNLSNIFVSYI